MSPTSLPPEAFEELAELASAHLLARTPRDLAAQADLPAALARLLRAVAATEPARRQQAIAERLDAWRALAAADTRPPRALLAPELLHALTTALATPWTPSERLVQRLLDHPALRALAADVLRTALERFTAQLRQVDHGRLGGLGGKAARAGRGVLGGFGSGLSGGLVTGLLGTLLEELEGALRARVTDFLGGASQEAVAGVASWVSDPAHADAIGELRARMLDVLLDTPLADLVAELPADMAALTRAADDAVVALAADEALAQRATEAVEAGLRALGPDAHAPLRALLDELDAADAATQALQAALARHLLGLSRDEGFLGWWARWRQWGA
jgi:hypothetical protein